jgi:hypothetical protein
MSRSERFYAERPILRARRVRDGIDTGHRSAPSLSALGILSVVCGLISLVIAIIPCVGSLAMISGILGVILGGIGAILAGSQRCGRGVPITGIAFNALSIAVSAAMAWFICSAFTTPNPDTERVKNETAIPLDADRLASEYESDPEKADSEYKGKVLEVTGKVLSVKGEYPYFVVTFCSGGIELKFRFYRGRNGETKMDQSSVGELLTIRGLCSGAGITMKNTVHFGECIVSRGPPSP